jgi:nucleoside-diphosphate-sugar epimerase
MVMKRVFVVGGTGFLGYHAIQEFLAKGWNVTAVGLPPAPPADLYPSTVEVVLKNIDLATDAELLDLLRGHDGLVFAAGLDDRHVLMKPAYDKFYQANVVALKRLLYHAKEAGVKRVVVMGSYFAYFHRVWPELRLAEQHPYIRSRVEQEQVATSIPGLDGMVLELPYIFGAMPVPGWKSLWTPLVKYLRAAPMVFYTAGGTACISATVAGRAIVAALARGEAGQCYPISQENLTWREMLMRLAIADQRQVRVVTMPTWAVTAGMFGVMFSHQLQRREGGLDMRYFAKLQTAKTFIDPEIARRALGFELDNLDDAFRKTVDACN